MQSSRKPGTTIEHPLLDPILNFAIATFVVVILACIVTLLKVFFPKSIQGTYLQLLF
jgi:hypothetical protein